MTIDELREIHRYYLAYCVEHGVPETWTQRSEVFEAQITVAIEAVEALRGFTQEDVELALGMAEYVELGSYARLTAIGITTFNSQPARALKALATRLTALLPPTP